MGSDFSADRFVQVEAADWNCEEDAVRAHRELAAAMQTEGVAEHERKNWVRTNAPLRIDRLTKCTDAQRGELKTKVQTAVAVSDTVTVWNAGIVLGAWPPCHVALPLRGVEKQPVLVCRLRDRSVDVLSYTGIFEVDTILGWMGGQVIGFHLEKRAAASRSRVAHRLQTSITPDEWLLHEQMVVQQPENHHTKVGNVDCVVVAVYQRWTQTNVFVVLQRSSAKTRCLAYFDDVGGHQRASYNTPLAQTPLFQKGPA